jgi:2-polyprenyl-6-methoxyphenol hydroxylase-like FAD-dependent oxidoreductase
LKANGATDFMTQRSFPARVPVLIVGGGPVGLALALDLGWRGVECLVVERNDGTIAHPRANAENSRSMEFFRRWGIANAVRAAGTPEDYPHTALYLTDFDGFEISRIERPQHGGAGRGTAVSPERPHRCNQLWLDPILRERATGFESVRLIDRCRFETFRQDRGGGIVATLSDLDDGRAVEVRAQFVIACCGGHSSVRRTLGIGARGDPAIEYNLDFFFRTPRLWTLHDKGKAALYFLIDGRGLWRTVVQIDGRELWRLNLRGKELYDHSATVDPQAVLDAMFGRPVPAEFLKTAKWIARDLVADGYGGPNAFLAGDAAHQNTPAGGFGLNTGLGDAVDLGWKLAAVLHGWGGPRLLDSYEAERRPVALRNVEQATYNYRTDQELPTAPDIGEDSPAGAAARARAKAYLDAEKRKMLVTDGTALGYRYDGSPILCDDGSPPLPDTISEYRPSTRPGTRAPHAWMTDGRSVLDLYGRGFVLLDFSSGAADTAPLRRAFARRGVPLGVAGIAEPDIAKLYERDLVLVRPDGHVAWRGDTPPADPDAVADRVRGA